VSTSSFRGLAVAFLGVALLFHPTHANGSDEKEKPLSPTRLKMPGPAAQNLMLGTWVIRVKYEPGPKMPKGGAAVGSEVWRSGPGGRSVIEEYQEKGDAGEIRGLGIAWWDEKAKGRHVLWCDSDNPEGCHPMADVARWEGDSLVSTEESESSGKKVVSREIFTDITPTSFTQILKSGPSATDLKTTITIHATRVTAPTLE
jgi:hypothetical protein